MENNKAALGRKSNFGRGKQIFKERGPKKDSINEKPPAPP